MSKLKKIRCPFCKKVITESVLYYDFDESKKHTNRYICSRCKRKIFYSIAITDKSAAKKWQE